MANLKGLKAMVSQLREQRTNFVNQIRHVDAALVVLGKLEGRSSLAKPVRKMSGAARRKIAAAQKGYVEVEQETLDSCPQENHQF